MKAIQVARIAAALATTGVISCVIVEEATPGKAPSLDVDASVDASTVTDTSTVTDASTVVDASTGSDAPQESGPPADAAPDADAAADAKSDAAGSPCLGSHAFCRDFDDGVLTAGFTDGLTPSPGATIEISTAYSVSPTRSLRAFLPQRATTQAEMRAAPAWGVNGWKRARMELDVYVPVIAWQGGDQPFALFTLYYSSSMGTAGTVLFLGATECSVATLSDDKYHAIPNLTRGAFNHVVMDIHPQAGQLIVSINGAPPVAAPFAAVVPGANPFFTATMGPVSFRGPHPAFNVYVDNAVVDLL
jgi:hypothetical protein